MYKSALRFSLIVMVEFADCVEIAVDALSKSNGGPVDETMFIDVAGFVHEGIREIRKAVAMRDVIRSCFFYFMLLLTAELMKIFYFLLADLLVILKTNLHKSEDNGEHMMSRILLFPLFHAVALF